MIFYIGRADWAGSRRWTTSGRLAPANDIISMTFLHPRNTVSPRRALIRLQATVIFAGALLCIACPPNPNPRLPSEFIDSVQPADRARLANPPPAISARLRFQLDSGALEADWLRVRIGEEVLAGDLTIEGGGNDLVWRPSVPWPRNQQCEVVLSPNIRFASGRRTDRTMRWSFLVAAEDATELHFVPLGTMSSGLQPYEVAVAATESSGDLVALWWTRAVPSRQEAAFRSGDPGSWTSPSLLLDSGFAVTPRQLVADSTQAWLFDPQQRVSFWHERAGGAFAVPLAAPQPFCLQLAGGETVVWSASAHRAATDPASYTFDPLGRAWLPTLAVADFGPGIDSFFGVLPFDGQGAQQIVRLVAAGGRGPRVAALPMARDGTPGAPVELAEVGVEARVAVAAASDGHAAVLIVDGFGPGQTLRVHQFGPGHGWRSPELLFSGLDELRKFSLAIAPGGRVLLAVSAAEADVRVAEVLADGTPIAAVQLPIRGGLAAAVVESDGDALLLVESPLGFSVLGRRGTKDWSLPIRISETGLLANRDLEEGVVFAANAPGHYLLMLALRGPVASGTQHRLDMVDLQLR